MPIPEGKPIVWDLPIRLFHWSLALLVAAAAITGFLAPAWWLDVHVWAGWGIGALLVFRLVWGLVGSEHARFRHFPVSFHAIFGHAVEMIRLQGRPHPGHTPLGAAMVAVLLVVLLGLVATGAMVLGGQEKIGPLAGFLSFAAGHGGKEVHEALAVGLLVLVGLHVAGVVVESWLTRENLVRAMANGRKRAPIPRPARRGALALAGFAIAGTAGSLALLAAVPPKGIPDMPRLAAFEKECGACHGLYHPSLLPATSWEALMEDLSDHFGENASLPPAAAVAIAAHLRTYAAESWDSEAANRLRQVSAEEPLRISGSPFWRHRHRKIPDAVFAAKPVSSRANCFACHGDAAGGRFADTAIRFPKETSQ
ncbi:MAG: cytochrome b/b6 domain-containing protein [Magnetospirillum sp. WYHS-4]